MGVAGGAVDVVAAGGIDEKAADDRLRTLFETHHARLYRLARRLTATADDAADLVQETFLRAARAPASVPSGPASEEAWLVRVLVNLCRDGWRRRSTRRRLDGCHLVEALAPRPSHPEAALVASATVWRALRQLTPRRRAAIILHDLDGVSVVNIARMLGVSAVTVRWHLSRGRRQLAAVICGKKRP
jgi:RNA polymerase sigma-70 factor (ECF subfamily)